jgi:hypothetical protein
MKKTLARVKKDLKLKVKKRGGMSRKSATVVLAQGAGAAPRRNFGTRSVAGRTGVGTMVKCLDARIPRTLGLPRAVGPYTVIRTTRLHQSSATFIMFAPFMSNSAATGNRWYNWCGVEDHDSTQPINATNNTRPIIMPLDEVGPAVEVVPAALTVQVMNPASLQSANGVFAMSRVNQQLALGGSVDTWDTVKHRIISYFSPRLLTGGKLALRGVKCSTYPLNMSEYSDFCPLDKTDNSLFAWDRPADSPAALAPIVFVQNNSEPQTLEFLVTIEWRVRFDPGNPASASHMHHDTLSDEAWNAVSKTMSSAGHGVEEMAEGAAEAGALGYGVVKAAGRFAGVAEEAAPFLL